MLNQNQQNLQHKTINQNKPMNRLTAPISYFTLFIFAISIVSCTSTNNSESAISPTSLNLVATATPSDSNFNEPYPGPSSPTPNQKEAYPIPSTEEFIITSIPTPSADVATITGVLLRGNSTSSPKPASTVLLALAKVVDGPNGEPMVVSFSQLSAPRALTDSTGRFVFSDVPPGHYALIYDRISDAFLLNDPETGGDYLFVAEASQILDLGELIYTDLPNKKN